jgi:hypothetical protein
MSTGWRNVHFRDGDTPVGIDERLIETRGANQEGLSHAGARRKHRRATMIEKFTGALLSPRLWCAASVARRAALRLLSKLPDTLHPFSDVAGPPDRPRCHTNFARHPLRGIHTPSPPPLDPDPPKSATGGGQLRPGPIVRSAGTAFTDRPVSTVHEHTEIFVALPVFAGLNICFTVEPLDRLLKWREFS